MTVLSVMGVRRAAGNRCPLFREQPQRQSPRCCCRARRRWLRNWPKAARLGLWAAVRYLAATFRWLPCSVSAFRQMASLEQKPWCGRIAAKVQDGGVCVFNLELVAGAKYKLVRTATGFHSLHHPPIYMPVANTSRRPRRLMGKYKVAGAGFRFILQHGRCKCATIVLERAAHEIY